MIADREIAFLAGWSERDAAEILGDILCQRGYLRGALREFAILAQHETVVLDDRSAARRRDQDGVETTLFRLLFPHVDVAAGPRQRVAVLSEVMGQRAAALLAPDQHDL